jgi:hypothetical protein
MKPTNLPYQRVPGAQAFYRRADGATIRQETYQPIWTVTLADGTTRAFYLPEVAFAWAEKHA